MARASDFSADLTQEEFTEGLRPSPTPPDFGGARQRPSPFVGIKVRQRKLGDLRRLATFSGPEIRAHRVQIAVCVHAIRYSDIRRTNDLAKTAQEWQQGAVLKYARTPRTLTPAHGDFDGRIRARGEGMRCGEASLVGWSDSPCGD